MRILYIILILIFSSCTSLTYTHKIGTTKYQIQESPEKSGQFRWDHGTHTIAGMDSGGGFCASLATGLDAANSRAEAIEDAAPYQGSITYDYRVHTAREFQGARCGSFFRWGSSEDFENHAANSFGAPSGTVKSKNSVIEGGLVFDYGEPLFEGVVISPRAKIAVGVWDLVKEGETDAGEGIKFGDFSFGAALHIVPGYLFGFGIHPWAEFNLANFSLSYGVEAGYTLALGDAFSIQLGGLFEETESAWPGSYELLTRSFGGYIKIGYFW